MSDQSIEERLRELRDAINAQEEDELDFDYWTTLDEAVEEIARLRDEVERLTFALDMEKISRREWLLTSDEAMAILKEAGWADARALREALGQAVVEAHQSSEYHPRGTGAFPSEHGGQWRLCPEKLCVEARALLSSPEGPK